MTTLTLNPISVLSAIFGGGKVTGQRNQDFPRTAATSEETSTEDREKAHEPHWQGQWSTLKYL